MKQIWRFSLLAALLMGSTAPVAQPGPGAEKPEVTLSGYADVYYVYDMDRPDDGRRQSFLYNHNRHNEFNLNLGFLKCAVTHSRYRSSLALQAGTYVTDNYAAEAAELRHIAEASAGVRLGRKGRLWLDAGIMPSHIGFESAVSMDNATLTRSILAENSPYYMAGAKLSAALGPRWNAELMVLNGWQRIGRVPGNGLPSWGTRLLYKPTERLTLNHSGFAGTDDPDTARRMRWFSNFYALWQATGRWDFTFGYDCGFQETLPASRSYNYWYAPVFISRYAFRPDWKAAFRAEYYHDHAQVLVISDFVNGRPVTGLSLNLDYLPAPDCMARIEGRWMASDGGLRQNWTVAVSIAVKFIRLPQPHRDKN